MTLLISSEFRQKMLLHFFVFSTFNSQRTKKHINLRKKCSKVYEQQLIFLIRRKIVFSPLTNSSKLRSLFCDQYRKLKIHGIHWVDQMVSLHEHHAFLVNFVVCSLSSTNTFILNKIQCTSHRLINLVHICFEYTIHLIVEVEILNSFVCGDLCNVLFKRCDT